MKLVKNPFSNRFAGQAGIVPEHAAPPGFRHDFQNFANEVRTLPGVYTEPKGCILPARRYEEITRCVALRAMNEAICEMKRMYIRTAHRVKGLVCAYSHLGQKEQSRRLYEFRLVSVPNAGG